MKTRDLLLVFALFWISFLSLSGQVLVSVNNAITQDVVLTAVQRNSLNFQTVVASGQAVFSSNSGYVRILLSNDYGYDLLIYESFPLVAINGIDNFSNVSIEAVNIPANLALTKIRVEIKNAELRNLSVDVFAGNLSRTQQQQARTDRIALINNNLRAQNALWGAGETSISQMSFEERKRLFGGRVPDLAGFQYYVGGIFVMPNYNPDNTLSETTSLQFVPQFDWRNRHGKNWITPAKDQGRTCASCWAFAVVGTVEAYANLYYNRLLNLDLSEQAVLSCVYPGSCSGGYTDLALWYIKNIGVVDEACFIYEGMDLPCDSICSIPNERIKIENFTHFSPNSQTSDDLKKLIIQSPMTFGIRSWWHVVGLVGYKMIQTGDRIFVPAPTGGRWVIINPGHPLIGSVAWLVKNSWGTSWGDNGFGYVIADWTDIYHTYSISGSITSLNHTDADVICEDRDGDGYYFWGVGPKPDTCPPWAPDEPDGDDSNPNLGPMDEFGNLAVLPPFTNITTSQTWSTNRTVLRNIAIPYGVTLTITATVFLSNNTITIRRGGKLILSGGIIGDGSIVAQGGSELIISNNGRILLGNDNNLDIRLGAVFELIYGEVSVK